MRVSEKVKWACPDCGIDYDSGHQTKQQAVGCLAADSGMSNCGFMCECEYESESESELLRHGESLDNRCQYAKCEHCGWSGAFPVVPWKKEDCPSWAQIALEEGWVPPNAWDPSSPRRTPGTYTKND